MTPNDKYNKDLIEKLKKISLKIKDKASAKTLSSAEFNTLFGCLFFLIMQLAD